MGLGDAGERESAGRGGFGARMYSMRQGACSIPCWKSRNQELQLSKNREGEWTQPHGTFA